MKYRWWPIKYKDKKPEDMPPAALKAIEAINQIIESAEENMRKHKIQQGA